MQSKVDEISQNATLVVWPKVLDLRKKQSAYLVIANKNEKAIHFSVKSTDSSNKCLIAEPSRGCLKPFDLVTVTVRCRRQIELSNNHEGVSIVATLCQAHDHTNFALQMEGHGNNSTLNNQAFFPKLSYRLMVGLSALFIIFIVLFLGILIYRLNLFGEADDCSPLLIKWFKQCYRLCYNVFKTFVWAITSSLSTILTEWYRLKSSIPAMRENSFSCTAKVPKYFSGSYIWSSNRCK